MEGPAAAGALGGFPLLLSVPRADTARGVLRRHTSYLVRIDDCGRVYERHRRYTNFLWLHRELRQREVAALPELPPKRALGSLEQAFVEQRRRLLEAYLQALLRLPAVVLDDALWAFLDADLATAAVPRFLCRPSSPTCAFECLTQLAAVAAREGSAFRLCSLAVLRELARFAEAEAAEAVAPPAQGQPALQQARLGSRLRLCSITQALARHERARQALVEAGMFGALLALLWRTTEDCGRVLADAGLSVDGADAYRSACEGVKQCLNLLLEGSQGIALLDFCQQDSGLRELQRLATAEATSLHVTVANLLWHGFQSSSVVAALAGANMGLKLIGKLLQSPELPARILASLCVGCLVRQEGVLDAGDREVCLQALAPLPKELEQAEADVVARAAASTLADLGTTEAPGGGTAASAGTGALAAERDAALVELLRSLCGPDGVPRLQALLGEAGAPAVADAVTGAVVALLDCFARQSLDDPERLRALDPLAAQLQALLDEGEEAAGAAAGAAAEEAAEEAAGEADGAAAGPELRGCAARVLLRLERGAGARGREAPPLAALGQRVRVLEALARRVEARQARAAARLALAGDAGGRQEAEVRAARLAEEPCLGAGRLEAFGARLAELAGRRAGLGQGLEAARRGLEALGAGLDQRGVQRGVLDGDAEALRRALAAQAERERGLAEAEAVAAAREEQGREAAAEVEAQLVHLRATEAALREATLRSREAEDRAAALAHEEAERAEICHNAPAQLERLQARLEDVERRRVAAQQSAAQLDSDADQEERQRAALAEAELEAEAALRSLSDVGARLQALQRSLTSELVLSDEEVGQLRRLEAELQPARPARLRHGPPVPAEDPPRCPAAAGAEGGPEGPPAGGPPPGGPPGEEEEPAAGAAPAAAPAAPPLWDDLPAEREFRELLHFRAFARLRGERERLWAAERAWLQAAARRAEAAARRLELRRAGLEAEGRAAREEAERLGRDLAFWAEPSEHARRLEEARAAAAAAREAARAGGAEAAEALGGQQLAEARLEQARARAREAEAALAAAREEAGAEAERSLRERLELEKRCSELEARARAHAEGWAALELQERRLALLQGRVAAHLRAEAQGRGALRAEVARLVGELHALDRQLDAAGAGA